MFLKKLSLIILLVSASTASYAQNTSSGKTLSDIGNNDGSVRIIEPKKDVQIAESATIDTEKFEFGVYAGFLAVEDFNTNPVLGASFSYHLTPKIMLQLNYGQSDVEKASFEKNIENASFLADADRRFDYYNLLAGYKVLRGRSFFGANKKYNSDIYLLAGLGSVDYAGDSNTSVVIGTSYRVVLTDYLTANLDVRGHSVDREFLNDSKQTFNAEYVIGINVLF